MRLYGRTPSDFTWDGERAVAGQPLAVSLTPNASGRLTTGIYNLAGAAVTQVVSDSAGDVAFQGDDSLPLELWVTTINGSGALGSRWYVIRAALLTAAINDALAAVQATATQLASANVLTRLAALETKVSALEDNAPDGPLQIEDVEGLTAALVQRPIRLHRSLPTQDWRDAAGTAYPGPAVNALRPATIDWHAAAGAEPEEGTDPLDANPDFNDVVLSEAPDA